MSDEIEAVGALATGGAAAHAIDPAQGRHGEAHGACLNCGTLLDGRFCRECGQPAHVHRTLGHVFEEFLHGLLHLDTKAWRTLPMLLFRPGRLTYDYVHGKRARYIAPFALFLFTIFLMFFVFGFVGGPQLPTAGGAGNVAAARIEIDEARERLRAAEARLTAARANPAADASEIARLSAEVVAARTAIGIAERSVGRGTALPDAASAPSTSPRTWQDALRGAVERGDLKIDLSDPELNKRARQALLNPDFTLYKIQQKAYKLSFLLVPMSLPFLWLLFAFRRDVTLYDHTVFALYSLSFMSLLFVTIALLFKAGAWGAQLAGLLFFVPPMHMYAQLKGAYSLGWFAALWRTWWLLVFSAAVLAIYAAIILLLGLVD